MRTPPSMHYAYVLQTGFNEEYYIGYTKDLIKYYGSAWRALKRRINA